MNYLLLGLFLSSFSLPGLAGAKSEHARHTRSITICPQAVATNFSSPRLQVFLTINSQARVFWDGTFEKRRLELNWVNPPDRQETDYIGLYRDDPQWFGQDLPLLRIPASYPGQYYLSSLQFPDINILHPSVLPTPPRTMCLYNYWIAYVRSGTVLAVNCVKTQPVWMWEMKEHIGSIPLHALMIPGTHNAGAYDKFTAYTDDTVVTRYSVNQGEDVWTQLLFGIRYLDLRVSYYNDTPEKFWLVHDFVKQNPLYEAVHAVKRFLRMTKELVIIDFHRFPFGFTEENTEGRHEELVDYINSELGEFMAPDWLGKGASMNDLWHLNRTLIVTYQDDFVENRHDNLWTEALHAWGNTRQPRRLFTYLDKTMTGKQSASYLWVAMTHLTPSKMDVFWNLTGGFRQLNDKIAKSVTKWFRDIWWQKANIVATDFFLSNNLVDVSRTVNRRRAVCRGITRK
eukprot:GFUD01012019.1.p1 GENE.GFUD01012019.1~~GFUD01012019.1.p1  ORF type:complete len:456 (-),score=118.95 GFUD01012019.1:61-1428(-)